MNIGKAWIIPVLLLALVPPGWTLGPSQLPLRQFTPINGDVTVDTTWSGSIEVETPVTVQVGVNLTVAPGTEVVFDAGTELVIDGNLSADGANFSASSGTNGDWNGIVVRGGFTMTNSTIRHASIGLWLDGTNNSSLDHTMLEWNSVGMLLTGAENVTADNNTVVHNLEGINITAGKDNIVTNNTLANHPGNVYDSSGSSFWYGNFFNDYPGVDAGGDAIGDTAHTIGPAGTDAAPRTWVNTSQNASSYAQLQVALANVPEFTVIFLPAYHVEQVVADDSHSANIVISAEPSVGRSSWTGMDGSALAVRDRSISVNDIDFHHGPGAIFMDNVTAAVVASTTFDDLAVALDVNDTGLSIESYTMFTNTIRSVHARNGSVMGISDSSTGAIRCENSTMVMQSTSTVVDLATGIHATGCGGTLTQVTVEGNGTGILVEDGSGLVLSDVVVDAPTAAAFDGEDALMIHNLVANGSVAGLAVQNGDGITIQDSNVSGDLALVLEGLETVSVSNVWANSSQVGILLNDSSNVTVTGGWGAGIAAGFVEGSMENLTFSGWVGNGSLFVNDTANLTLDSTSIIGLFEIENSSMFELTSGSVAGNTVVESTAGTVIQGSTLADLSLNGTNSIHLETSSFSDLDLSNLTSALLDQVMSSGATSLFDVALMNIVNSQFSTLTIEDGDHLDLDNVTTTSSVSISALENLSLSSNTIGGMLTVTGANQTSWNNTFDGGVHLSNFANWSSDRDSFTGSPALEVVDTDWAHLTDPVMTGTILGRVDHSNVTIVNATFSGGDRFDVITGGSLLLVNSTIPHTSAIVSDTANASLVHYFDLQVLDEVGSALDAHLVMTDSSGEIFNGTLAGGRLQDWNQTIWTRTAAGSVLTDVLTLELTHDNAMATVLVNLSTGPVSLIQTLNHPPVITTSPLFAGINASEDVVYAVDYDALVFDLDALSFSATSPANLTVITDDVASELRLLGDDNWSGSRVVQVTATDSFSMQVNFSLDVAVLPINDPPFIPPLAPGPAVVGITRTIDLSGVIVDAEDPAGVQLNVSSTFATVNGHVIAFDYTAAAPSREPVVVTAWDGQLEFPRAFDLVVEHPPQVSIVFPEDGDSSLPQQVNLRGEATDLNDGALTEIEWRSDQDGFLGRGSSIVVNLSIGTHVISASIEDSFGQSASTNITYEIEDPGSEDEGLDFNTILIYTILGLGIPFWLVVILVLRRRKRQEQERAALRARRRREARRRAALEDEEE